MVPLLQPNKIMIGDREFILSKFPAVAGREIVMRYSTSAVPKIGEYKTNEEMMYKILSYVAIPRDNGSELRLNTEALINNHVVDWEILVKLEMAMMEYNVSFFQNGRISTFFGDIVQNLPAWISKISTALSGRSSQTVEQPSTNSTPSTP